MPPPGTQGAPGGGSQRVGAGMPGDEGRLWDGVGAQPWVVADAPAGRAMKRGNSVRGRWFRIQRSRVQHVQDRGLSLSGSRGWAGACAMWLALTPAGGRAEPPRVPAPRVPLVLERSREGDAERGPKLEPIGGGRLQHRDPRFTAIIAADGSVEFKDVLVQGNKQLLGIDPLRRKLDPPRSVTRDDFEERAVYAGMGPSTAPMMAGVGGSFGGLAAAVLGKLRRRSGAAGPAPPGRNAAAKAEFMRATEGVRTRLAHAWLKSQLDAQLGALTGHLLEIWRDESLPLAERKRRIFVAWDECDEGAASPATPTDEIRTRAARQARARVLALIRLIAPRGSPQKYTAAELAGLNARRRSQERFEPYATAGDAP